MLSVMSKTDYLGYHEEKHVQKKDTGESGWSEDWVHESLLQFAKTACQQHGILS